MNNIPEIQFLICYFVICAYYEFEFVISEIKFVISEIEFVISEIEFVICTYHEITYQKGLTIIVPDHTFLRQMAMYTVAMKKLGDEYWKYT